MYCDTIVAKKNKMVTLKMEAWFCYYGRIPLKIDVDVFEITYHDFFDKIQDIGSQTMKHFCASRIQNWYVGLWVLEIAAPW